MKFHFLFLFILLFKATFGQKVGHRFGAEIASYSLVFYPQQFENISTPTSNDRRLYETEVYDITHSKINFSLGLSFGFTVNWINREKWRLAHRFSLGIGKFNGTTELTLKSHGDSLETNLPYTTSEVSAGYQSSALFEGYEYFLSTDLMLFRKFDSNWELGVAFSRFQDLAEITNLQQGISPLGIHVVQLRPIVLVQPFTFKLKKIGPF